MIRATALSLFVAGAVFADGVVEGPAIGLLFNEERGQLRVAEGIPGAATLSQPVAAMRIASVGARIAVGISEDAVAVYNLRARTIQNIAGALLPEKIAISPSGTAAALVAGQKVQIIKNLAGNPSIASEFDAPEAVGVLAVSDDGAEVLWALGGALYRNADRFGSAFLISTIDYFPGSHDAVIADREEGKALLLRDGSLSILAQTEGLTAAAAGSGVVHALVKGKIVTYALDGTSRAELACSCESATLARLADNIFRLTPVNGGATWIFDASGEGRVLFVPGGGNE